MDQDTVSKVADATGEVAKTTDTALKLAGRFGSSFKGALDTTGKMLEREIQFIAARRALNFSNSRALVRTRVGRWRGKKSRRTVRASVSNMAGYEESHRICDRC